MKLAQLRDNKVINVLTVPNKHISKLPTRGMRAFMHVDGLSPAPQRGWVFDHTAKVLKAPAPKPSK